MRRLLGIAACAVVAGLGAAPGAWAAATPFQVGAATADVTPPLFDSATDLADFPEADPGLATLCPRATYGGPRTWRFEEPYTDSDGSGAFSYPFTDPGNGGAPVGEPYCDYNHNNRWDGIYSSGGIEVHPTSVHDPIDARAIAFSDGTHTVVVVSVVAQGFHGNYLNVARDQARALRPGIDDVVISANHNESSPDTVGIYGGPNTQGTSGLYSGIDDYYYEFLERQIAKASADAFDALQPAGVYEIEFDVPASIEQELSKQFPTTDDANNPAAIDPKVRVLQARDAGGNPIFTMANVAAHNQEIGHGAHVDMISSDWPGYFHDAIERDLGGMGMFLAADIGSMEDLKALPRVPNCDGCFEQAQNTGEALASAVEAALPAATALRSGPVGSERDVFDVPLENNVFRAAAEAGLFGQRQLYTAGQPTGRNGPDLRTSVAQVSVGPDLQFLANPGEAFPALMLGSRWGINEVGCPNRENPPAPTWHSGATHRFQIGLGDDLIGYEIPAWAFSEIPGVFAVSDAATCFNDPNTGLDPAGHDHKLETEGVGPTASNLVAIRLTALLDQTPDPVAKFRPGRFIKSDGSLTRDPRGAVAAWIADPGSTVLGPGTGTIVALSEIGAFGSRSVDASGRFMDFDGAAQAGGPDISSRGMIVPDGTGGTSARYYVDVYPALTTTPLGASVPRGSGGGGSGGPCAVRQAGTQGADKLIGTAAGDRLIGRRGDDLIKGRGGKDCLIAGKGGDSAKGGNAADQISGGPGRDRLFGGRRRDTIRARDGERDVIDCGKGGHDTAIVDFLDSVRGSCETVKRPRPRV